MAKNSGRRSAADLNAAVFLTKLNPTRKLCEFEQGVWDRVMGAWPADHWIQSDSELLTQYCAACKAFEQARKKELLPEMDKAGRLSLSYATKLRITPQSRYDHKGTHTEAKRGRQNEAG